MSGDRRFHLLIGAGFSRNWGGLLADEVLESLLGFRTLGPLARESLVRDRHKGGFEAVLGALQSAAMSEGSAEWKKELHGFQEALISTFDSMNEAFSRITDFDLNNSVHTSMRTFLGKFDSIFSLNQDLLLELTYQKLVFQLSTASGRTLSGVKVPFVKPRNIDPQRPRLNTWTPDPNNLPPANIQPLIKLHGSTNWIAEGDERLLVKGTNKKSSILADNTLQKIFEYFTNELQKPNVSLMVIGYGFRDDHVNEVIQNACRNFALKLFIVDPRGIDIIDPKSSPGTIPAPRTELFQALGPNIIGASRRSLRETFGNPGVEFEKLQRFFN